MPLVKLADAPPLIRSSVGHSVVLGVLVAAENRMARDVHRSSWLRESPCIANHHGTPGKVLVRFVLSERERDATAAEIVLHADLAYVSGGLHIKPLAWLQYAVREWPAATLIGKMDGDTFVYPCMLLHDLEAQSVGAHGSLYYGTHMLWHSCARRGPPRMTCYAQGGLYILSRHLTLWLTASGYAHRHAPVGYSFEDVTLGAWIRHFAETHNEVVRYAGNGSHGDRGARLGSLASGRYSAGPFIHLNLGSGGNVTAEPLDADWCVGVYREYGCCAANAASDGRRLRRHCAALESSQCRREPLRPRPVTGCQGDVKAMSGPAAHHSHEHSGRSSKHADSLSNMQLTGRHSRQETRTVGIRGTRRGGNPDNRPATIKDMQRAEHS